MNLFMRIRIWLYRLTLSREQRKEFDRKLAIAILRAELAFWGHDTSDMTDEEIEAGVMRVAEILGNAGVSAQQAADNLRMAFGSK